MHAPNASFADSFYDSSPFNASDEDEEGDMNDTRLKESAPVEGSVACLRMDPGQRVLRVRQYEDLFTDLSHEPAGAAVLRLRLRPHHYGDRHRPGDERLPHCPLPQLPQLQSGGCELTSAYDEAMLWGTVAVVLSTIFGCYWRIHQERSNDKQRPVSY
ncbi:Protein of unknown function [Gryllus bimaculatus]|nr:Protein of unknown function [Gryllus bimaculatus]